MAHGVAPRALGQSRIADLQEQLLRDDSFIPNRPANDPKELVRRNGSLFASPTASGAVELLVDGISRDLYGEVHHWQFV